MANIAYRNGNATSTTTLIVCHEGTKSVSQEAVVSWIVDDMKDKMVKFQPGEFIKTDTFTIKGTKWHCRLYLNGRDLGRKGNISVYLHSENTEKRLAKCEFNGGKSDHGWFKSRRFRKAHEFYGTHITTGFSTFFPHDFVLQNEKQLIKNGRMEFEIKVSLVDEGESNLRANLMEEASEINRLRKLSDNFSGLLWDESTSDFQIICGDEKFPVHRIVLKARSSFYSGLFKNDYTETKTGHLVIEDMDSDTVRSLIEYIYTGRFKDLKSETTQLLKAADKYDFPLLKKYCEDELISTVNVENAVDLFVLAEDHKASELRVAAKKMILENKAVIVEQDGWDAKLGTLVIELFKAV